MLNVSKYVLILCFLISSPAYAADISDFDVKGIKLGSTKEFIKNKVPCSNWRKLRLKNGEIYLSQLFCGKDKVGGTKFYIELDHNDKVTSIIRRIEFSVMPDIKKIKAQLIEKYGKPLMKGKKVRTDSRYKGYHESWCYGACQKEGDGSYVWQDSDTYPYKTFQVSMKMFSHYSDVKSGNYYILILSLDDYKKKSANYKWERKMKKLHKQKLQQKESNIVL